LVKGTPAWVYKRALILNCISSYLFIFYTLFLHGLLCYIPSILDNSCVSELCSSHLVSELRFLIPAFGHSLYQTFSEPAFSQLHRFKVSLRNLVFDHQPGLGPFKFSKFLGTSILTNSSFLPYKTQNSVEERKKEKNYSATSFQTFVHSKFLNSRNSESDHNLAFGQIFPNVQIITSAAKKFELNKKKNYIYCKEI
jgi:hypothetical protein